MQSKLFNLLPSNVELGMAYRLSLLEETLLETYPIEEVSAILSSISVRHDKLQPPFSDTSSSLQYANSNLYNSLLWNTNTSRDD